MLNNRISATLSPADRDEIMKAIATIKEKMPFLLSLTSDEIPFLPKMGTRSRAFVDKALEVATQNPDIMPRGFDIEEMRKDIELYTDLTAIRLALVQLLELVESTTTLTGSEAYVGALAVYTQTKNSYLGAGLEAVSDEMGQRFGRKLKPKPENPEKPPTSN